MQAQLVNISSLKNNLGQIEGLPKNPRLLKNDKFRKLKKSLVDDPEMLELREIIAYDNNGEFVVVCGNMRLLALKEIGVKEVHTKILPYGTAVEKLKAYTIKDNVGFGEHDWDMLANEWDVEQLVEWGLDIPNFDTETIEAVEDDFDGGIPDIPITVLGDLYEIGEHRLLCGDSTDSDQVVKLMDGQNADMVFTDPMYQNNPLPIISIFNTLETNYFLIMATFKQCMSFVNDSGFRFRFDLVFNQKVPSSTMNKKVPYYLHKNLIYLTKDDSTIFDCDNAKGFFSDAGYYPSIIESAKNTSEVHGLTKNSDGIIKILSGFRCKSILDLFIGSGSTMVASHQLKRKCYGMELDPKYCDVIVKRMIKLDDTLTVKRNGIEVTNEFR